ncbi:MAG: hypothetical protein ACNA7W_19450, partial [Pseudomonadales bacterium]
PEGSREGVQGEFPTRAPATPPRRLIRLRQPGQGSGWSDRRARLLEDRSRRGGVVVCAAVYLGANHGQ